MSDLSTAASLNGETAAALANDTKNDLVKNFLPDHGFEQGADGRYRRSLLKNPPAPESALPIAMEISHESRGAPLAA